MKKKIVISVLVLTLTVGAVTGGILGYRSYSDRKLTASVMSVADLNTGYWGDSMESYGMITNDDSQNIYLATTQSVQEVFVEEGQIVSVGDPLLQYDMTVVNIEIEMQKLQIQAIQNNIALANQELEKLKKTTPIPEQESGTAQKTALLLPERTWFAAAGVYGAANNLTAGSNAAEGGTQSQNAGDSEAENQTDTEPETETGTETGTEPETEAEPEQPADTEQLPEEQSENPQQSADENTDENPEGQPEGYTAEELKKAISDKEKELKGLDLDKRKAELTLKQLQSQSSDGMVRAAINGTVKTVGDLENLPNDGTPFLTVTGSEGLYVKGSVSELVLEQIHPGQIVSGYTWDSGISFEATITEIDDYPQENADAYGGNPCVSYYAYTAYIEDSQGLINGEYAQLNMEFEDMSSMDAIYLEKAYVRQKDGKSYVFRENEDGRLEKRYVQTGRTVYGYAVEIKSGITEDDYLAFPYGKTAKDGVRTSHDGFDDMY